MANAMPGAFDPVAYINAPDWHNMRPGLSRMRELLRRLGSPQRRLRVVHVAGTNGKGSTCAMVSSVLREAGYRCGLFTSPYIFAFNERICVGGVPISDEDLFSVTLSVRDAAEAMDDHPTEFELMCAVALVYFTRSMCDVAVLEVGLGGRLDATNVVEAPEVCAIAPISRDHMAILGDTVAEIAAEKAAIIKPGATVVSAPQPPDAAAAIRGACEAAGCALAEVDAAAISGVPGDFSYKGMGHLRLGLLGSYQTQNAALAIEVLLALRARGFEVDDDAIRAGLTKTAWPGRFQVVAHRPTVIVDGGHNEQGAHALVDSLRLNFPDVRPVFLMGVLADKDYPAMLDAVVPMAKGFVCITPENPRALPADALAQAQAQAAARLLGCASRVPAQTAQSVSDGVRMAIELAGEDGVVCAFGSLYSIAAVTEALDALRGEGLLA